MYLVAPWLVGVMVAVNNNNTCGLGWAGVVVMVRSGMSWWFEKL